MIFIQKRPPRESVSQKAAEIKRSIKWKNMPDNAPEDENEASQYSNDLRVMFDEFAKEELREAILTEQHYICAYCMRRISNDGLRMRIEHWYPLSKNKHEAINYNNFLGVCKGVDYQNQKTHACCDVNKGGQIITLDPRDKRMMSQIRYESNGRIYFEASGVWTNEEVKGFQHDIDKVLMLNGLEETTYNYSQRAQTPGDDLKSMRKSVYKGCKDTINRLSNRNKLTISTIQKLIDKIESKEEYDEFVGVKLFYFNRWIKRKQP